MKKRLRILALGLCVASLVVGCSADSSYTESATMDKHDFTNSISSIDSSAGGGFGDIAITADKGISEQKEVAPQEQAGEKDKADVQIDTSNTLNRKVIKYGYLTVETDNFNQTVDDFMKEVDRIGGFTQDCYISGDQSDQERGDRYAELTVRVPKTHFDRFMNDTEQYGNVIRKSIEGQDVTDHYFDTEMRLETLEIQKVRLDALLEQAGDLEDLFAIERELQDVTYEIESLKGTLNKYDSLIDFATVQIEIEELYEYTEQDTIPVTFGEKVMYQLENSWEWVLGFVEGMALVLIAFLPIFGIVILPPVAVIVIIVRTVRKKRRMKNDKLQAKVEQEKSQE